MEDNLQQPTPEEQNDAQAAQAPENTYVPRPAWQVWGARVLLVAFLILLAMYYLRIARG